MTGSHRLRAASHCVVLLVLNTGGSTQESAGSSTRISDLPLGSSAISPSCAQQIALHQYQSVFESRSQYPKCLSTNCSLTQIFFLFVKLTATCYPFVIIVVESADWRMKGLMSNMIL